MNCAVTIVIETLGNPWPRTSCLYCDMAKDDNVQLLSNAWVCGCLGEVKEVRTWARSQGSKYNPHKLGKRKSN